MVCPNCGFKNNVQAKFCNECGSALEVAAVSKDQESYDEFDFSPIGAEGVPDSMASPYKQATETYDVHAFDEYLIDGDYRPPVPSFNTGDTMEMPRIEGESAPEQKAFLAPEEVRESKKGRKVALILVLLLIVTALAGVAVTYQMEIWGGKSIPDVVGLDISEATQTLEAQGFTVKTMQVKSDDAEDIVLLMDPGAGGRLSEGSEIVLQVATPRIIPEVVGLTREEAEALFEQEGFSRVEYIMEKSNEPENQVLSLDPEPGTKAKSSLAITVVVAEAHTVPDVVGLVAWEATEALIEAGYEVHETYVYSEATEGTVASTDPEAGTKLETGSSVTISIAKSRASELWDATNSYLANNSVLQIAGVTYEVQSVGNITYVGDNMTKATLTVVAVTTLDGEVVRGSAKERTVAFTWSDDNQMLGYA